MVDEDTGELVRFNSIMVRLRRLMDSAQSHTSLFQFHYGAIKTVKKVQIPKAGY